MNEKWLEILRNKLQDNHYTKLLDIDNHHLVQFVAEYIELCKPADVYICTDSQEDLQYIRESAIRNGEEEKLAIEGHTIHFDGYHDQARDKAHTQFLLPKGVDLGPYINGIDKEEGLKEIKKIMKNIMVGKTLYVRFFCLGPTRSEFSMLTVQLTDSAYVAHSLDLLYRQGYEEFKRQGEKAKFFRIVHSAGELENGVSKNVADRRIYIDTEEGVVFSANTQYGGNTLGLKKLSMRLAIKRASEEGWLCEHMFVMGVHGNHERITYFTGAFPSLCGKTSTSTLVGETIVGDDIAYLRKRDGKVYAVNVEKGMFGIIMGVNSKDDPIIWEALNKPNEIIFSNVLKLEDGSVYWIGKDSEIPEKGVNYSGEWTLGKRDEKGNEITSSHKNARFTLDLKCLENVSAEIDNPFGVHVSGFIYGGRDSNTWVPVREAFDWKHGIISVASALESETTAATLGREGVPKLNPMSNLDFIPIPLGQYIQINLDFGCDIENPPHIFGVNYFLQDKKGNFVNDRMDKRIWLKWMEQRVHGEVEAIDTPVGRIPVYQDLKRLFHDLLGKEYTEEDYVQQFTIRVNEFLNKIHRVVETYKTKAPTTPDILFEIAAEETQRLNEARAQFGDYIAPQKFIY
ncbi:phosphoenolpyruvate carboxykinase (GTP) [bacterium]|nr:phosphoenolpyruvate carboxykinase (GTP) [bacterium]RQV93813.1 MAG: phosphoenolpyruvate carboxykinase (GTP) [bacterium]